VNIIKRRTEDRVTKKPRDFTFVNRKISHTASGKWNGLELFDLCLTVHLQCRQCNKTETN
jgi:hypothetical protein